MMLFVKWYFAKRDFTCFAKVVPNVLGVSNKPIITWQRTDLSLITLIPNVKKLKHPHIKCGNGYCKFCNGRKHMYFSSFLVNMVGMYLPNNLFINIWISHFIIMLHYKKLQLGVFFTSDMGMCLVMLIFQ